MKKQDVYLSVKTGGGKSLVYQAFQPIYSAVHSEACSVLVVSPLLSIMKEQCTFLNSLNISATYIGKEASENDDIVRGKYDFVFTSPESLLAVEKWRDMLVNSSSIKLLVVDEAHTVLQWGDSQKGDNPFIEWYGKLGEVRSLIDCPLLLITATANESSRKKMLMRFSTKNCVEIIENPDRTNIKLFVEKFKSNADICDTLYFLIETLWDKGSKSERQIIFCQSIKTCGEVFTCLRMELGSCQHIDMYHSKTPEHLKEEIKKDMGRHDGRIRVLVATSAAGMGVNFVNVKGVIHYGPTSDLDSFIQQYGRAGRDTSDTAFALLLFSGRQCRKLDADVDNYIKNTDQCRRQLLLSAYNATPNAARLRHLCCDVCDKTCDCQQADCSDKKHPCQVIKVPRFSSGSESDSIDEDI